jgi:hypothetical protein
MYNFLFKVSTTKRLMNACMAFDITQSLIPKEALEFESLFLLWRTKPLTRPRRKDLLLTLNIRTNHFEASCMISADMRNLLIDNLPYEHRLNEPYGQGLLVHLSAFQVTE